MVALAVKDIIAAVRGLIARFDTLDAINGTRTGWAFYGDGGAAQVVAANTRTQITIDEATTVNDQLPDGVAAFWVSDKIVGRIGDAKIVNFRATVTQTDAAASMVTFDIDIGGGFGIIDRQEYTLSGGSGVARTIGWTVALFNGATFEANGGSVFVTVDGPAEITDKSILVQLTHRGRE